MYLGSSVFHHLNPYSMDELTGLSCISNQI